MIKQILKDNINIIGQKPKYKLINETATHTTYQVNGQYNVTIYDKNYNETIDYLNTNIFVPKIINTKDNYIITEVCKGKKLSHIWPNLEETEREKVIKQISDYLNKKSPLKTPVNWLETILNEYKELLHLLDADLFTRKEIEIIKKVVTKLAFYLKTNEQSYSVNTNLNFNSIHYDGENITISDYEQISYAPKDFEIKMLSESIEKPWQYFPITENTDMSLDNFSNINSYFEKYCHEFKLNNKEQRIAIYKMLSNMNFLEKYPMSPAFKKAIMKSAKTIAFKDELNIEDIKNEHDILDWLDYNIKYGWKDKNNIKHINSLKGFRKEYKTMSLEQIIEEGLGICVEQAKLIAFLLDKIKLNYKIFCHYEKTDSGDEPKMHCFVTFEKDDHWYLIEHSDYTTKGITKFVSLELILKKRLKEFEGMNQKRKLIELKEIPNNLTFNEFIEHIEHIKEYHINKQKTFNQN